MHKINAGMFLAILACFTVIITAFPRDTRMYERENRDFNAFPEITADAVFSRMFASKFDLFLSDKVGFRTELIDAAHAVADLRGFAPGGVYVSKNMLVLPDRIVEIFRSNKWVEINYSEALTAYRAALPDDVRIFSLLIPTQIEFQEERYKAVSDSQRDAIDMIYASLQKEGIITVDAYSALKEHISEYIYFRTDHHWTTLGAYYAYLEFAKAAGFEPVYISKYKERRADGFRGYLLNRAMKNEMLPDTVYWYEYPNMETSQPLFYPPSKDSHANYDIFIGGNHGEYVIKTNSKSEKTAIVIKDSYANSFIPWLSPHYSTIVELDPRKFSGNALDVISQYEQADVIFVNYVLATTYTDFIFNIKNIL